MPELTLPQGTITYRESGSGQVAVFLHGYLTAADLWDGLAQRLAPDMRCIALDLPLGAHRRAMRPDADLSPRGVARLVADALGALDLHDVTLVGNDSGGAIAQLVATEHPERLGRLVLTPCDCFDNFPPKMFRALLPVSRVPGGLSALFAPLRLRAPQALPFAYGWLAHRRPLPHHLIDGWVAAFYGDRGVRRDTAKFTRGLDPAVMVEAARRLQRFERPALLAFAEDDRFFPIEHAQRLAAGMPDARAVTIPDSRTWVMIDQPEHTASLVRDFVGGTPARAGGGSQAAGSSP